MAKKQIRPTRSRARKLPEPREAGSAARPDALPEAPEAAPATLDLSKVTKAAASLAILAIRQVEVSGTTTNRAFIELPSEVVPEIFFTRPKVQQKDAMVAFQTTFTFRLHPVEDGQAEPVAEVRATTELVYSMKPDAALGLDDLQAFGNVNAPFNAWPYWREITQALLTRLGLPALPLPLFHVNEVPSLMRD